MFKKFGILFLYTETPLHWGAGSSVGPIDLPVQRERHTGYPTGQGAGIKGSLRDLVEKNGGDPRVETIFGPETGGQFAGCVAFGDARLVLFPVRSLRGTFAHTTSRLALERLSREAGLNWKLPEVPRGRAATSGSELLLPNQCLVLEEGRYDRTDARIDAVADWLAANAVDPNSYWAERIRRNLVLLNETDFQHLVTSSTIVETHTKIDDRTGTVASGALFQAEYVPSDALFHVPIAAADPFEKKNGITTAQQAIDTVKDWFDNRRMQTGADASTGRGIVYMRFVSVGVR